MPVKTIAMPKIAELYHSRRHGELVETLDYSAKLVFWTTAPVSVVLVVFAGPSWASWAPSSATAPPCCGS